MKEANEWSGSTGVLTSRIAAGPRALGVDFGELPGSCAICSSIRVQ